jgi:hypothetical protein
MNFIEHWFNISPDNGSGSLEISFVLVMFVIVIALFVGRKFRRAGRQSEISN